MWSTGNSLDKDPQQQECKGSALVMADTNSVKRALDRAAGKKWIYDESTDSVCSIVLCLGLQDLKVQIVKIVHSGSKEKEFAEFMPSGQQSTT